MIEASFNLFSSLKWPTTMRNSFIALQVLHKPPQVVLLKSCPLSSNPLWSLIDYRTDLSFRFPSSELMVISLILFALIFSVLKLFFTSVNFYRIEFPPIPFHRLSFSAHKVTVSYPTGKFVFHPSTSILTSVPPGVLYESSLLQEESRLLSLLVWRCACIYSST